MLTLRAYRSGDAEKIAPWLADEQVFTWWSAGKLGAYPLAPETLDAYYTQHIAKDGWMPKTMEEDGEIVGSMLMRREEEGRMHFGFIVVNPAARGKGLGSAMLNLALEYAFQLKGAKRVTLDVFEENLPAIHCYERLGFARGEAMVLNIGGKNMKVFRYEKGRLA